MSVLRNVGTRHTPQSQPVHGKPMVQNAAGGYTFQLDDFGRLQRFLILGVDAGTYYTSPQKLATDNAAVVQRCLDADPQRAVDLIREVSVRGRAPKPDPALFALAVATAHPKARQYALTCVDDVCRTGTHLFHFAEFVQNQRGWGRGLRRAVGGWYERDVDSLAYQLIKYRQRDGWTHRDLLRLAHPTAPSEAHRVLYEFACGREVSEVPRIVEGYLKAKDADADEAAELVREYRLPWETLSSEHLKHPEVWQALLDANALPVGALVRKLSDMSKSGVLVNGSNATTQVVGRLGDVEAIKKARLHPVAILNALVTYQSGRGFKGSNTWTPASKVVDALDGAFYAAFGTVVPAGKRTLLGLDVSGSMTMQSVYGAAFNAMQGATAMAMVTAATEPETTAMAFSHKFVPVDVSPRRRLDDQMRELQGLGFGATDCALPMLWALQNKVEVDTFVTLTDNETWYGSVHPFQALTEYREKTGIAARLVVVGMTATESSIADSDDAGSLDVVGFDTSAPQVISDFSAGRV